MLIGNISETSLVTYKAEKTQVLCDLGYGNEIYNITGYKTDANMNKYRCRFIGDKLFHNCVNIIQVDNYARKIMK